MKRVLCLLMLTIFLINVGGYYLIFVGLQYGASKELSERIDNRDLSNHEMREFKIPITLPYPLQERDYERVHGEFEFNGEYYMLAEQKLANDTLYIKGVKSVRQMQLSRAMREYSKLADDPPAQTKHRAGLVSKLIKEYKAHTHLELVGHDGWFQTTCFSNLQTAVRVPFTRDILYPPDNSAC